MCPGVVLGRSDHTPGHAAVLGAVALGARAIEKTFTDDCRREGPEHGFALDPSAWRAMVDSTRHLEAALGDGNKTVQPNEIDTVVIQRRCLRLASDLAAGGKLLRPDNPPLLPPPPPTIFPPHLMHGVGSAP